MVVGMPDNRDEQYGGDEHHDVTPVLGEIPGLPPKLLTLLLSHEEGLDVLSEHSLQRGSTGHLGFRNPLEQFQVRKDDGSQVRNTRSRFARHAAEQNTTG